jgi:gliding motility-associated-like protein
VNAGADSTICLGQNTRLNATGAATYQWLPPTSSALSCTTCPDPIAIPTITTLFTLRGTSALGCQADDSIRITVIQPSTVVAPPNDSLCLGQGLQLFARGTQVYNWSPADGLNDPSSSSPIARPTTTTTYVVTGSDSKGCFVTQDSVTISVFPVPSFDLGPDVTMPVGNSVQFRPVMSNDLVSINWSPTTGLSCTNCYDPVASPKQKTQYTATVSNNGGCTTTDQITVFVTCGNENLFIPNTFSPNNDGTNDVFYPRGRGLAQIKSIRIFSRWGQQVFSRTNVTPNDPSQGWNGTFNGSPLPEDVYVYFIEVFCENNSLVTMKGDVMLVR